PGPEGMLVFQGAGGDQTLTDRAALVATLQAPRAVEDPKVPCDAGPAPGEGLSLAAIAMALPGTEVHAGAGYTHRGASNLVDFLAAPTEATLSVARLGALTLIAVPGEPTSAAGRELRKAVGDPDALILGLCNGYVGYIETPD